MKKINFNDRYGLTDAVIEGRKIMTRRLINPMPKDCATTHKNCWGANWSDEPMSLVVDRDTGGIYCKYCGNGVRLWDEGYHYKTKYKVGEIVAVDRDLHTVTLEDRRRRRRTFPLGPGFLLEGRPVILTAPVTRPAPAKPTRTASGSVAVDGAKVSTLESFYKKLWDRAQPDGEVQLTILQGADLRTITLKAVDRMTTLRKPGGI